MKVLFRTDASHDIGTGHVMRCLALADALRAEGAECSFVCREHAGNLIDAIRARGHTVHPLPQQKSATSTGGISSEHAAWLGADWATDAEQTLAVLGDVPVDWLVVDHYCLDVRWEARLSEASRNILVIDDLADRPHDCDYLLDQNLNRKAADYAALVPARCRILAGPQYALLRPEFAKLREYSFARRSEPRLERVLISMGGVDKGNVTARTIAALPLSRLPATCRITVVMGQHAPWLAEIRAQVEEVPGMELMVNVSNMAELMANSDLAIGAAGTSAWERCCLGLPTLTMVLAENQQGGAAALSAAGAALLLSDGSRLAPELEAHMTRLQEPQAMQRMQEACRSVCDGMGLARIVEIISHAN